MSFKIYASWLLENLIIPMEAEDKATASPKPKST
jgi:hypothetical protein